MNIGNKIKELRRKSGLTQDQLAQHLGISPQSVSKWETNTTMPDITLLPLLSKEFGITIDELFDLSSDIKLKRIEKKLEKVKNITPDDLESFADDFFKTKKPEEHDNHCENQEKTEEISRSKTKVVLKSLRAFENSLKRNCEILENAGYDTDFKASHEETCTTYTITVKIQ